MIDGREEGNFLGRKRADGGIYGRIYEINRSGRKGLLSATGFDTLAQTSQTGNQKGEIMHHLDSLG